MPGYAKATRAILATAMAGILAGWIPPPRFSLRPGKYDRPQVVTITDRNPGVTIFYTTDGTAPSRSSSQYKGPIIVSDPRTLQAIAATATKQSQTVEANYHVNTPSAPLYVIAGSGNPSNSLFGIIDFSNPSSPNEVDVMTPAGGTIVACNGPYVAVGDANGGRVWIYSITNPSSPLPDSLIDPFLLISRFPLSRGVSLS
jgi:hypothetical protein